MKRNQTGQMDDHPMRDAMLDQGWGGFPGFWSPITFLFSVDLSYNIVVGKSPRIRQNKEKIVSMVINCILRSFRNVIFKENSTDLLQRLV